MTTPTPRSSYVNHFSRTPQARAAQRDAIATQRAHRRALTATNGGVAPTAHHTNSTYLNWGCRCGPCRADHAERQNQRNARRRAHPGAGAGFEPAASGL